MTIKSFLDKKPCLSEIFEYVEAEAKRIVEEKKGISNAKS